MATCTDSHRPVYTVDMLKLHRPGVFIVRTRSTEMDDATLQSVDRIIVNTREGFTEFVIGSEAERNRRPSSPEYRRAYEPHPSYDRLADIIVGKVHGRADPTEAIFHHNQSSGIQFSAVGRLVYERAKAEGLGMQIPMEVVPAGYSQLKLCTVCGCCSSNKRSTSAPH